MAAVAERAASAGAAPPSLPGAGPDPFLALVAQAQAELAEAVERAGLGRDPYRFLVGALAQTLGVFPSFVGRLDAAVEHARQPMDPAALARLEAAAAIGAARHTAEIARAHARRTALLFSVSLISVAIIASSAGFMWGRTKVQDTERRLAAAFTDGAEAASHWVTLMENNDLPRALSLCTGARTYTDQTGRKACLFSLYLEAPSNVPNTSRRR